jgi:hypothetical protein
VEREQDLKHSELTMHSTLNQLQNVLAMHRDICALKPIRVRHPRELGLRYVRIVPYPVVLHPERPGRPYIFVREALGVEDPDDGAPEGRSHHEEVREPLSCTRFVQAVTETWVRRLAGDVDYDDLFVREVTVEWLRCNGTNIESMLWCGRLLQGNVVQAVLTTHGEGASL